MISKVTNQIMHVWLSRFKSAHRPPSLDWNGFLVWLWDGSFRFVDLPIIFFPPFPTLNTTRHVAGGNLPC